MPRHLFVCIRAGLSFPLPLSLVVLVATQLTPTTTTLLIATAAITAVLMFGAVGRMPVVSCPPSVGVCTAGPATKRLVRIAASSQAVVRIIIRERA